MRTACKHVVKVSLERFQVGHAKSLGFFLFNFVVYQRLSEMKEKGLFDGFDVHLKGFKMIKVLQFWHE